MHKKYFSLLISMILIFALSAPAVMAANGELRYVKTDLPVIKVEYSDKISESDIDSAKLGGEALKVSSVEDAASLSKLVYVLIDTSTSMRQKDLDALKPGLIRFFKELNAKTHNKAVLMTFGEDLNTLLNGHDADAAIESAVNSIKCISKNTKFYTALNDVYNRAEKESGYDKSFAIVISDGTDIEVGNSSEQEVIDRYKSHRLPVFALCQEKTQKTSADGFGYIARSSGGELLLYNQSNADAQFNNLKNSANHGSLISLKSGNRKSAGTQTLELAIRSDRLQLDIPVYARNDQKAPKVTGITFNKDLNAFIVSFSEDVDHADRISSYSITQKDRELTIVSVSYKNKEATVSMEKPVYSGTYTFEFESITDISDNANALKQSSLTRDIEAVPVLWKVLRIAGIVCIPLLFLLAIYLILLLVKSKKKVHRIKDIFVQQEEEEYHEQVHIKEKQGMPVMLYIDGADGTYHSLKYNLISSIIIGSSTMCDIQIDDSRMSKQHFVVERVKTGLTVTDLNSTNGTYINGVRIQSPSFLRSGDRVFAGNSAIRFVYQ